MTPIDINQPQDLLLRLGAAALAGAVIGVNRDLHHKPAGLRVMSLVALGAAVITIGSATIASEGAGGTHDAVLRTVQGILAGIGFLGAGVILRRQAADAQEVHGLTTASSIWVSCILGIVIGLGQWLLGAIGFAITLVVLIFGRRIEHALLERGRVRDKKPPGHS